LYPFPIIGACEQQLSGTFVGTDTMFKSILRQEASNGLEKVMKTLNFCVKTERKKERNVFPEDGQLFWSRIVQICCNDDEFVAQLPSGFKKHFFLYKNSLETCKHLKKCQLIL
jgi:hypothetical protein